MDDAESQSGGQDSVWRFAWASRAHVIVDADGYFELVREAMCKAEQRIFMIGWDFDTRIHLSGGRRWWQFPKKGRYPARLGDFIFWLARRTRGLEIRVLKWNFAFLESLLRGAMGLDLLRWALSRRIHFKFDSAHPAGSSHHQKLVVIDDTLAVCGGIDMTLDRWDTRAHLDEDPRRRLPNGKPYDPWHDATMMLEGEVASVLAELGAERWRNADGDEVGPCAPREGSPWPDRLKAEFVDVEVGIARSRPAYKDRSAISEIEALFLEHIARARRFVYAETQYFASRRIAEAIAARLEEPDPPEFLIVMPETADGWLEQVAMDTIRARLLRSLSEKDRLGRLRVCVPYTVGGTPIYVHAKLTIVDDEVLRVGSANMNNRSMGLDTECDVFLDAARPANVRIVPAITRLRHSLLAEHCGLQEAEVAALLGEHGSMLAMLDALPQDGKHLAPLSPDALNGAQKMLADNALLDPEEPDQWLEPIGKRGLFRRGGRLPKPR